MTSRTDIRTPRCLTKAQAAEYVGLSSAGFSDWVRQRRMPPAIPGTHRWDRKAIDAALDKLSGLEPAMGSNDAYGEWKDLEGASAD